VVMKQWLPRPSVLALAGVIGAGASVADVARRCRRASHPDTPPRPMHRLGHQVATKAPTTLSLTLLQKCATFTRPKAQQALSTLCESVFTCTDSFFAVPNSSASKKSLLVHVRPAPADLAIKVCFCKVPQLEPLVPQSRWSASRSRPRILAVLNTTLRNFVLRFRALATQRLPTRPPESC